MKYSIISPIGDHPDVRTAAFSENGIDWWNDGEYEKQRICTTAFAAYELATHLKGECELISDRATPSGDTLILLGGSKENEAVKKYEEKLGKKLSQKEGASDNSYRMLGFRDGDKNVIILSGADRVGTLYAAYSYLERMGVSFTEPGTVQYTEPELATEFDVTEEPSFKSRGAMSSFIDGDADFLLWMARNKFNSATFKRDGHPYHTQKKLGIDSTDGGHKIFYTFVQPHEEYPYCHKKYGGEGKPSDPYPTSELCRAPSGEGGIFTYGDAHPEWYALVDGERRMQRDPERFKRLGGARGDNICTSNEDATSELCLRIIDSLASGDWKYVDRLNLWPIDNGTWCECEKCQKLGNFSRRILLLAYKLDKCIKAAREVGKIKRPIHIICPAYHETLDIPSSPLPSDFDYTTCSVVFYPIERCYLHRLDDPVCQSTNAILFGKLLPWTEKRTYSGDIVIGEYYNVSTFAAMPFVLTERISEEIPMYHKLGSRQFHYMHMTARDWGFIAINNYLHAKLIWNKDADPKEITDRYFKARYNSLAGKMKELYLFVEKTTANCKAYKHYQLYNGERVSLYLGLAVDGVTDAETLFPSTHMKLDYRADTPEAGPSLKETLEGLIKAKEILTEMINENTDKTVGDYLSIDMRRLDYGMRMTEFLYLACLCSIGKDECIERLRELGKNLEEDRDSMRGYDFGVNFENALMASWIPKTYYDKFAKDTAQGAESDGNLL